MRPHNNHTCHCGSKMRQHSKWTYAAGHGYVKYRCFNADCQEFLTAWFDAQGNPASGPPATPPKAVERPLCPWFSTLPVPECWSLRT